ncbi:MAG: hypothetical protein WA908_06765, partial [Pontixanthobacter sp.]
MHISTFTRFTSTSVIALSLAACQTTGGDRMGNDGSLSARSGDEVMAPFGNDPAPVSELVGKVDIPY